VLATVPSAFDSALKVEGTGRFTDGGFVNYSGSCSCPPSTTRCYTLLGPSYPWGQGVLGYALVPFRSIAVDHTVIPYGTTLYVPELDGITMPGDAPWGAFIHDGCVKAVDTGGAIVGQHIDWFAALKSCYLTLDGALGLTSVTVRLGGARCP